MFQRLQDYELLETERRLYRPRAYGDRQPNGRWDGWLVFFPVPRGIAIAPPQPETTQSTHQALTVWAAGLTSVYLQGALTRALELAEAPAVIGQLAAAEYDALEDATRLETKAATERTAAEVDDAAAILARSEAERLREERRVVEDRLAAQDEATATIEAELHERAARDARAVADAAAQRRRSARRAEKRRPQAGQRKK